MNALNYIALLWVAATLLSCTAKNGSPGKPSVENGFPSSRYPRLGRSSTGDLEVRRGKIESVTLLGMARSSRPLRGSHAKQVWTSR